MLDKQASGYTDSEVSPLHASPLQQLYSPLLKQTNIRLFVKRDDLIHPLFGGNKWRKLKYNIAYAKKNKFKTLLTFGGAWSNHIYATAAAGNHFNLNTIGIIRGEQHTPLNATLSFAVKHKMQLHYVDRDRYRLKNDPDYLQQLKQQFGDIYIIPEGGSNELALEGCKEIIKEIKDELDKPFDVICCACGTGATLAGLILAKSPQQTAIGFSALKGGSFLEQDVFTFINSSITTTKIQNWKIEDRYHFGGYAKINDELITFMREFKTSYGFNLDAVYTAKMFYGLFNQIKSGGFKSGTTIVAIHSGGLQGNKGFNL